jgi:hypothetical protein
VRIFAGIGSVIIVTTEIAKMIPAVSNAIMAHRNPAGTEEATGSEVPALAGTIVPAAETMIAAAEATADPSVVRAMATAIMATAARHRFSYRAGRHHCAQSCYRYDRC